MTNYEQITEEHREYYGLGTSHLGIYKQLYRDKTHFVYELLQNADDSKSQHLALQLGANELFVWNDGCQFHEADVRHICSIGASDKDLTQIGTFGIGFKAVYTYTDLPEIYSGDERFRIRDFTKPEGIANIYPRIAKQVDKGRTVFHLPFKNRLRQEYIAHLKNRLCDLEKRSLLFLRHLKTVQWRDERDGQTGSYFCHRRPHDKIQNASEVELIASINGNNQLSETFLVFRREVQPPQEVIAELLDSADDHKERDRIQRSAAKQQLVEVAFKLSDGQITVPDSCVLFAYLPTEKETHLRFLIQGRYQTTPARDNIPTDNPWNKWLVQETANFLPEVLEQLKMGGLLEPAFFNVLPLEEDDVPPVFDPIAEALRTAMKDLPFVPIEGGGYAKAESVFYPHTECLRGLVESSWLHPESSWLDPEIRRDTEEFRRCFKVMREAGVKEVSVSQVLGWLEKQSHDWFEARPKEWLRRLYASLKEQKAELKRIKKLPLVRLENGKHVCASDQAVFLPPNIDDEREEIKPFLDELPIVMPTLLEGEEHNDIEAFLKNVGVKDLHPADMIREWIMPQYSQSNEPSVEQNRLHVRYLFKVLNKVSVTERRRLREKISEIPLLLAYSDVQRETYDFVAPRETYLPQAYTSDTDLETYFSVCDDVWFVYTGYLDSNSNRKAWLQFLKEIGSMDHPRFMKKNIPVNFKECNSRDIGRESITGTGEETIEDRYFHGLSKVLVEISEHRKVDLSQALWHLLVKALTSERLLVNRVSSQDRFFQGTYSWSFRSNAYSKQKHFDATFYRQLKKTAWLPDIQGNFQRPSKCFAPTPQNRRVLGDSVAYLHPDFDISNVPALRLAEKLGIHRYANTESVLNYLQTLSDATVSVTVNVEDIKPLYSFLSRQEARPREKFKEEPLIFTPNPEPHWWLTDEVFWADESVVFGNDRGYLKAHYPEILEPFFTALGVSACASLLDYVKGIRDVASGAAEDKEVRERVQILYRRLWTLLQEDGSDQEGEQWQKEWKQTCKGRYWLGKKGSEWGFFYLDELVWNDHGYRADLFEGKVPFWVFDDLSELAKDLSVEGCSQAEVQFDPRGEQKKDEGGWSEKVRNLRPYIHAFLKSPLLGYGQHEEVKSDQVLARLSVHLVEKLETTYKLKYVSVADPDPRLSFLHVTDERVILWLGLETDEADYADLIGDALQDYFDIKELREFAKDLLPEIREKVLDRWKERGLRIDLCVSPSETDSEEDEAKLPQPVDKELAETGSEYNNPAVNESEPEKPQAGEIVEDSGDDNLETIQSEVRTHHQHLRTSGTSSRGGHWSSTSGGRGGHGSGGGGGEGDAHRDLKNYLANNSSQLGKGLRLVGTEYSFKSYGKVDILLEDSSGNPVTVEVEAHIRSGDFVGVWQAVKYRHLAAVEYELLCKQVRSILAAPEIPDNVKMECRRLGIEPMEITV